MSSKFQKRKGKQQSIVGAIQDLKREFRQATADEQLTEMGGMPDCVPDVPRIILKPRVWTDSQWVLSQQITTSTTLSTYGTLIFTLASLDNLSPFAAYFDQFKILQAQVNFVPTSVPTAGYPPLYTVIDYDDGSNPTSLADLRQYRTCTVSPYGSRVLRTVNPMNVSVVQRSAGALTGFATTRNWCSTSTSDTAWYGVKWGIAPAPVSQIAFSIEVRLIVSFRNTK